MPACPNSTFLPVRQRRSPPGRSPGRAGLPAATAG